MVRQSSLLTFSVLPLLLGIAGCQKYTARPLEVNIVDLPLEWGGKPAVQGAFQLAIAEPQEAHAYGYYISGGGCVIAQDASAAKRCSTDDNCSVDWTDSKGVKHDESMGAYGYCLGAYEGGRTCWTKLSDNYCNKPVFTAEKEYTPLITESEMREYLGVPTSKKLD